MQNWRSKTLQELHDATEALNSVLNPPGGALSEFEKEQKVWRAYLNLEKNVAILKLELDVERPAEFIMNQPKAEDVAQYLRDALRDLKGGIKCLDDGSHLEAWERLRSARNDLRFYLREARRLRLKTARTKNRASN